MPQPSNRERAREILAAHQRPCDKSASGYVGLHMASFRLLLPEIAAAIDAAVEEEREACAEVCDEVVSADTLPISHLVDPRGVNWWEDGARFCANEIRARGASRE